MTSTGGLSVSALLACLADISERAWVLVGLGDLDGESCYIADATGEGAPVIRGYYESASGNVYECEGAFRTFAGEGPQGQPAVHVIGLPDGRSGQVTVRQEQGNYLRISNWDRIDIDVPLFKGATLRTLPQCGCGGSLGSPKLFTSFPEMCAYHFCAFYL